MCMYICMCMYLHAYVYTHACVSVCLRVCASVCPCVCLRVYIHACVCVRFRVYAFPNVCVYIGVFVYAQVYMCVYLWEVACVRLRLYAWLGVCFPMCTCVCVCLCVRTRVLMNGYFRMRVCVHGCIPLNECFPYSVLPSTKRRQSRWMCACVCVYAYVYARTRVSICVPGNVCMCSRVCMRVFVCLCVCVSVWEHTSRMCAFSLTVCCPRPIDDSWDECQRYDRELFYAGLQALTSTQSQAINDLPVSYQVPAREKHLYIYIYVCVCVCGSCQIFRSLIHTRGVLKYLNIREGQLDGCHSARVYRHIALLQPWTISSYMCVYMCMCVLGVIVCMRNWHIKR